MAKKKIADRKEKEKTPKMVGGLVCVEQSDGNIAILPDGVTQHFFLLEGISAEVLKLIDGRRKESQIAKTISKKHDLPLTFVKGELGRLIASLEENSIIY